MATRHIGDRGAVSRGGPRTYIVVGSRVAEDTEIGSCRIPPIAVCQRIVGITKQPVPAGSSWGREQAYDKASDGQDYQLNLKSALELPAGAPTSFQVKQPFESAHPAPLGWQADRIVSVHLKPFEVHTFESDKSATHP